MTIICLGSLFRSLAFYRIVSIMVDLTVLAIAKVTNLYSNFTITRIKISWLSRAMCSSDWCLKAWLIIEPDIRCISCGGWLYLIRTRIIFILFRLWWGAPLNNHFLWHFVGLYRFRQLIWDIPWVRGNEFRLMHAFCKLFSIYGDWLQLLFHHNILMFN